MGRLVVAAMIAMVTTVAALLLLFIPVGPTGSPPGGIPVDQTQIATCPSGLSGTSFGLLRTAPPSQPQRQPQRAAQYAECRGAASQRATAAVFVGLTGFLTAAFLLARRPRTLDRIGKALASTPPGPDGAGGPRWQVASVATASVLGTGCLLGGFVWIASSA